MIGEVPPSNCRAGFISPILIQCTTCGTRGRSPDVCQTIFRWDENEHLELPWAGGDAVRLSLIDIGGKEHVIESVDARPCSEDSLRNWRARFLRRLLGPRLRAQNQVTTLVGATRPQFQWNDNFHLVSDNLRYVDGADAQRLKIRDTSGAWHELCFGRGMQAGRRVHHWRVRAIENTLGGFCTVFGGKGFELGDDDVDAFEAVILAYRQVHDVTLPLREHMSRLQQDLSTKIRHFPLRLNICGPNFSNFLLSIVTSGKHPAVTAAFRGLQWAERLTRQFSRASRREWTRGLFSRTAVAENRKLGFGFAKDAYDAWKLYCNAFLDTTLSGLRRRILRDPVIRRQILSQTRPLDM